MTRNKYLLAMLSLLPIVLVFDTIYSVVLSSTLPFVLLTYGLHLLILGPVNLAWAWWLYRPIERALRSGEGGELAIARVETLAWRSTVVFFFLGMLYQVAFFAISPFIPQESAAYSTQEIPLAVFLTFIPPLVYVSAILPSFIAYFVVTDFTLNLKLDLHQRYSLVFAPGRRKIGRTLAFTFVIIGFIPSMLTLLSLASISMLGSEYAKFTSVNPLVSAFPDRVVEIVAMVFAVVFITRSFTHPIHSLLDKVNQVKRGDYGVQAAVMTGDEIGVLTQEFNTMVRGLQEREMIRDTFGKYVTKDVADVILEKKITLDGEVREATILITDIANYTTISENLQPRETVKMLNEYFTQVVAIVQAHHGVVSKFIGDSVFALFNVPLDDPEHAVHAVRAALEIEALTKSRLFGDGQRLATRIGINSGLVLAGNLGSSDRAEYTVIGNEVNVAARLESLNKQYGTSILLGENTYQRAAGVFPMTEIGSVQLKGKETSIKVYRIT